MNIKYILSRPTKKFGCLNVGDVFEHVSRNYMKIAEENVVGGVKLHIINAVQLNSGDTRSFSKDTLVIPIDGEFMVYGDIPVKKNEGDELEG